MFDGGFIGILSFESEFLVFLSLAQLMVPSIASSQLHSNEESVNSNNSWMTLDLTPTIPKTPHNEKPSKETIQHHRFPTVDNFFVFELHYFSVCVK